jgi:hypothetical protein
MLNIKVISGATVIDRGKHLSRSSRKWQSQHCRFQTYDDSKRKRNESRIY